ncbi:hypothetical protein VQ056_22340 [Paenibacillus sp. JTLBN-2024]
MRKQKIFCPAVTVRVEDKLAKIPLANMMNSARPMDNPPARNTVDSMNAIATVMNKFT